MEEMASWWRRPQLVAALACVALGLALLLGGPALRGALAPAAPPAEDLGLVLLDEPAPAELAPTVAEQPLAPADLVVYVSGAVAAPDVYRLPERARVLDAVLAAGGLLDSAASEDVNLAAPLSDAQHVHIPRQGEVAPAAGAVEQSAQAAPGSSADLLDLNRASAVDLEELPGVGQAIAGRIISYRETEGPFTSVDDLHNVSGIGDALFAKISPLVTVGDF